MAHIYNRREFLMNSANWAMAVPALSRRVANTHAARGASGTAPWQVGAIM
jgi:hypothetical protein